MPYWISSRWMITEDGRRRGDSSTHLFIREQVLLEDRDARQAWREIVSPKTDDVKIISIASPR